MIFHRPQGNEKFSNGRVRQSEWEQMERAAEREKVSMVYWRDGCLSRKKRSAEWERDKSTGNKAISSC